MSDTRLEKVLRRFNALHGKVVQDSDIDAAFNDAAQPRPIFDQTINGKRILVTGKAGTMRSRIEGIKEEIFSVIKLLPVSYERSKLEALYDSLSTFAPAAEAHDAQVAARAIRDAADEIGPHGEDVTCYRESYAKWLRARADTIESRAAGTPGDQGK